MASDLPVAVVTGAGSGIGRAICLELSRRQYRLVLAGRRVLTLNETAGMLETPSVVIECDVTLPEDCAALIEGAVTECGQIDALINNAGFAPMKPIGNCEANLIQSVFEVNAIGPAMLIAAAWPIFERQFQGGHPGACIVNMSSMATVDPFPGLFAYAAAKASLNVMAKACHNEGKDMGLRCFAIAPGAVETAMLRSIISEDLVPPERALPPEAIAAVVAECLLGEHDELNGQVIQVPSP